MPELANDAKPGDMRMINGIIKIALVGFDKNGDTCIKWYIPKTRADIHTARRLAVFNPTTQQRELIDAVKNGGTALVQYSGTGRSIRVWPPI